MKNKIEEIIRSETRVYENGVCNFSEVANQIMQLFTEAIPEEDLVQENPDPNKMNSFGKGYVLGYNQCIKDIKKNLL